MGFHVTQNVSYDMLHRKNTSHFKMLNFQSSSMKRPKQIDVNFWQCLLDVTFIQTSISDESSLELKFDTFKTLTSKLGTFVPELWRQTFSEKISFSQLNDIPYMFEPYVLKQSVEKSNKFNNST